LRNASAGIISDEILAVGSVTKTNIVLNKPAWIDVYFEQPIYQTKSSILAFTVQESSGGGSNGYNEYGMTDTDVYAQGSQFYSYSINTPIVPSSKDMAFGVIVSEKNSSPALPQITIISPETNTYVISISNSNSDSMYMLQQSQDLETWGDVGSMHGSGLPLRWTVLSTESEYFYRVKIEPFNSGTEN